MSRGRDTHRLIIDRRVLDTIVDGCSRPETMRMIFDAARELAFGRLTVFEFDLICKEQPCIFWNPPDGGYQIHVRTRDTTEPTIISIARVVWAAVHVRSEQGPDLLGSEELLHSCGNNGVANTGHGSCLNPAHLWRGDEKKRKHLQKIRQIMKHDGQHLLRERTGS